MNPSPSLAHQVEVQIAPALRGQADPAALRRAAEITLEIEGQAAPAEMSLVITDDDGIHHLNLQFRGVDASTDVLAFSAREAGETFVTSPEAADYLGDVIISLPRAAAQAAEEGHPPEEELALLVVHGVLHLLGYDHATPDQEAVMWARQSEILSRLA
jgi:probable rRNA maturation factor